MKTTLWPITLAFLLAISACSSSEPDAQSQDDENKTETSTQDTPSDSTASSTTVDAALFLEGALTEEASAAECELSDGTTSECLTVTVVGHPADHETGPFCPPTTSSSEEEGGIWFDGEALYQVDGEFILGLSETYADDTWKLYDEDGNVNITETAEEFELAARPDVDESLQNHCVEGKLEFLESGEAIPTTVSIPVNPTIADTTSNGGGIWGVTLNGVRIDGQAPVDAILSAYTIAAFDDCGGHYNPAEGYHMHAAMDCSGIEVAGHSSMFAYALDGFGIYGTDESQDLDQCGGHEDSELGYHYHASQPENNSVINCFSGVTTSDVGNNGRGGPGGQGGPPEQDDQGAPPQR